MLVAWPKGHAQWQGGMCHSRASLLHVLAAPRRGVKAESVLPQAWRHRWRHMRYKAARDSLGLPHIDWNRYHLQVSPLGAADSCLRRLAKQTSCVAAMENMHNVAPPGKISMRLMISVTAWESHAAVLSGCVSCSCLCACIQPCLGPGQRVAHRLVSKTVKKAMRCRPLRAGAVRGPLGHGARTRGDGPVRAGRRVERVWAGAVRERGRRAGGAPAARPGHLHRPHGPGVPWVLVTCWSMHWCGAGSPSHAAVILSSWQCHACDNLAPQLLNIRAASAE